MKKITIIIIIITILSIISLGIIIVPKFQKKLKYNGFTETEIKWIETLSNVNQEYFLKNDKLHSLLKENNFELNKFSDYVKVSKNNSNLSNKEIILTVKYDLQNKKVDIPNALKFIENDNFNSERLERYLTYQQENNTLEINKIIQLVNEDIDSVMMSYHQSIDSFIIEKYFIKENLQRYINYQEKYQTDAYTTVSYVNSNLDYDYYSNMQKSDMSKGLLVLVNKYYELESNYVPSDLVTIESKYGVTQYLQKDAYEAFKIMADDAKKEGLRLYIQSPYRSYQTQSKLYNRYCNQDGQKLADTYSARPGSSEHQTGLGADIISGPGKSLASFANTTEFVWMMNNAHKYGFILRYPKGKEKITGYQYEPWHYRYVGIETATKIKELDITYEEYYAYYIK